MVCRPKPPPIRWGDLTYDAREAWGSTLQNLVREGVLPDWGAEPLELVRLAGVDAPQHRLTIGDIDELLYRAAELLGVARR